MKKATVKLVYKGYHGIKTPYRNELFKEYTRNRPLIYSDTSDVEIIMTKTKFGENNLVHWGKNYGTHYKNQLKHQPLGIILDKI